MTRECCTTDLLPVFFVALLLVTLCTSFVVAVYESDIVPYFPAISDTAARSPESNVFSQFVNISTFIGFVLILVRYLQIKRDVARLVDHHVIFVLNRYSVFFGGFSIFGASLVANFPETQVHVMHDIGAAIFFVIGNVYAWFQVIISFHMMRLQMISRRLFVLRTVVSVISTTSLIMFFVFSYYSTNLWDGNKFYWDSKDPGYVEHVIGNASEWILVLHFLILILTFTPELCFTKLEISLIGHRDSYEVIPA